MALRMRGVVKRFGPVEALAGVDLDVRSAEVHALLGENGAGKSTLMKILSGAHAPDGGRMELGNRAYAPRGPGEARAGGVAMIYQELNLAPELSVEENVMLGTEQHRFGIARRRQMRPVVERALAELGASDISPTAKVSGLGPGQRQRVELARALVAQARLVVLDEPTSSLSRAETEQLFEVVRRLRARGTAVVYISHFLEEVQELCDRYTVLRDGRAVDTGRVEGPSVDHLIEQMAGRSLDAYFPAVPHDRGEVLLEVNDLSGVWLPKRASFKLHRGEILGVFGLVGAGRTELLRALFALDPTTGGSVRLAGAAAPAAGPRERLSQGVGLCSEDRKEEGLALDLAIADNTTLSRLGPFTKRLGLDRGAQAEATQRWIERLGIRCRDPRQPVGELSGGNQQKVALARLLHHDVDVALLDEPTRGIDVGAKVEIYRLLGELAASGKALLVSSSYLPELLGVCDSIAVLHRGVLGPARPVSECTEHGLLDEALRGTS